MWGTPQKKRAAARIGWTYFCLRNVLSTLNSATEFKLVSATTAGKIEGNGGEGGIRTLVTLASNHAFQACAFNHSATSPPRGAHCVESNVQRQVNWVSNSILYCKLISHLQTVSSCE